MIIEQNVQSSLNFNVCKWIVDIVHKIEHNSN